MSLLYQGTKSRHMMSQIRTIAFLFNLLISKVFCEQLNQDELKVFGYALNESENLAMTPVEIRENQLDVDLCHRQFRRLLTDFENREMWARRVMDSWGSIPPNGHLFGHYVDLGNFDGCMSITQDLRSRNDGIFVSQYCLARFPIAKISKRGNIRIPRVFVESREPTDVVAGVCVPEACDMNSLSDILREWAFNMTNNTFDEKIIDDSQCTRRERRDFHALEYFAIVVFSLFGVLMVLSTAYDVYTLKMQKSRVDPLLAFSIISNARSLFSTEKRPASKDTIDCLHGIRSLSIVWVIYGHSLMMMQFMPLINLNDMWKFIAEYYTMVAVSGPMAVDSFFLLSGLLVTFHVYREIDRSGRLTIGSILKMYLHRYLRLFPILAVTIFFAVSLYKYVGDGPYWKTVNTAVEAPCQYFWWLALLHLQNYVNNSAMCLGHTWYLSADTQLYILSPLILIPLKKWGRKFVGVIMVLILASCTYIFVIMYTYGFSMKLLQGGLTGDNDKKVMLYYGFHTRAPSWLIGVLLGHILYSIRDKKLRLPKLTVLLGWLSTLLVIVAVIWGPYESQQQLSAPSKIESSFYEALSRTAWAIALAWVVFACCQGYGGAINSFLSSPLWQPLSRMSYTMYVIHLVVQVTVIGMVRISAHLTQYNAIRTFWADFGTIFTISIIMVLAFESPMIALEKYFFGGRPKTKQNMNESPDNFAASVETLESRISESIKS